MLYINLGSDHLILLFISTCTNFLYNYPP